MDRVAEFLESEFPNAEERALLLGIASAPTDRTAKLVYADWLEDRSDARSEYVRLLVQRGQKKLTARMTELQAVCSGPWLSMLGELHRWFNVIKSEVEQREEEIRRGWRPVALATCDHGMWDFHYTGNLWLDWDPGGLRPVLDFLCDPKVAPVLRRMSFSAYEDHPATNGTLAVSLWPLVTGGILFPYLESLQIEQSQNTILSDRVGAYEEGGQAAGLLAACPRLLSLAAPSAPNADFLVGGTHPLEQLDVHAGYNTQRFIPNLAASKRFPQLRRLVYKDFCCEYMSPEPQMFTPLNEWKAFFRSPTCAAIAEIKLDGVVLSQSQVRELLDIRSSGVTITRSPLAP
ncbi:TIGR02996 domain-containing protein [Gemmata sp. JC673]|uniref:TIGR02996 domain-containing protein n=1 Tax=Gemmata algarum TaxID=2975278 RepID=A0ABU5EZX1_9BACT|nr:TIGR02996 domain-containing protein [Gemmata algarum]MDY3560860.1 TIGR02996 domain-containing protein [Gemmata algarum]